jgi:hypothetical protein
MWLLKAVIYQVYQEKPGSVAQPLWYFHVYYNTFNSVRCWTEYQIVKIVHMMLHGANQLLWQFHVLRYECEHNRVPSSPGIPLCWQPRSSLAAATGHHCWWGGSWVQDTWQPMAAVMAKQCGGGHHWVVFCPCFWLRNCLLLSIGIFWNPPINRALTNRIPMNSVGRSRKKNSVTVFVSIQEDQALHIEQWNILVVPRLFLPGVEAPCGFDASLMACWIQVESGTHGPYLRAGVPGQNILEHKKILRPDVSSTMIWISYWMVGSRRPTRWLLDVVLLGSGSTTPVFCQKIQTLDLTSGPVHPNFENPEQAISQVHKRFGLGLDKVRTWKNRNFLQLIFGANTCLGKKNYISVSFSKLSKLSKVAMTHLWPPRNTNMTVAVHTPRLEELWTSLGPADCDA